MGGFALRADSLAQGLLFFERGQPFIVILVVIGCVVVEIPAGIDGGTLHFHLLVRRVVDYLVAFRLAGEVLLGGALQGPALHAANAGSGLREESLLALTHAVLLAVLFAHDHARAALRSFRVGFVHRVTLLD